jgi:hypothetical protein
MAEVKPIITRDDSAYDNYTPRGNVIARRTLDKIRVIANAIKEAGSIPNGHLYAMVMEAYTFEEYEKVITVLKNAGIVYELTTHMLIWKGLK